MRREKKRKKQQQHYTEYSKKETCKGKRGHFWYFTIFFLLFTRRARLLLWFVVDVIFPSIGFPCTRWLWKNVTYLFYISHHNSNDIWASDFRTVFLFLAHHNEWSISTIDRWTHWNFLFDLFWIVFSSFLFVWKTIIKSQFDSQMDFFTWIQFVVAFADSVKKQLFLHI